MDHNQVGRQVMIVLDDKGEECNVLPAPHRADARVGPSCSIGG